MSTASDIDKLAQEALQAARRRPVTTRSGSQSTAALISLHSRLLTGKIAAPNLVKDKNGVLVQKSDESEEGFFFIM